MLNVPVQAKPFNPANVVDVVVIDSALKDQDLLKRAGDNADRYFFFDKKNDSAESIINRITHWSIQSQNVIHSISILSHGEKGSFQFGNAKISATTLLTDNTIWKKLSHFLSNKSNIYIYSCNTGSSTQGQQLLTSLTNITGANVFASNNITGLNGDWNLEVSSTNASAPYPSSPLNPRLLASYQGTLADTGKLFPSTSGPGTWTNPDNVFANDGDDAQGSGNTTQEYLDFNFGVPVGANIKGITVTVKAKAAAIIIGTADIDFQLSWDGGTTWSNTKTTGWGCLLICLYGTNNLGGSTDTWGHAWVASQLSNANFRIRGTSGGLGFGTRVDYIQVQVFYAAVSGANTTIASSPSTVTADGISTTTITVQARDDGNTVYTTGGNTIVLTDNGNAVISAITDNNNGTYTATMANTAAEVITVSGSIDAIAITDTTATTFTPGAATAAQTTISTDLSILTADGASTTTITVQTKDNQGNNLTIGGDTIGLTVNGDALISPITDVGNGTYTATITNTVAESSTISGTVNSVAIADTAVINFIPGSASTTQSTITASPSSVTANGISSSAITVQAKDNQGNNLNSGGITVTLNDNGSAVIGPVTDNGNGTYTASITSTVAEAITISGAFNGAGLTDTSTISFIPDVASTANTLITASPSSVTADGVSVSTITIQTKDNQGNNLTTGGNSIVLSATGDSLLSSVNDVGNGTYTATVTSTSAQAVTITGTLNGASITDNDTVTFIPGTAAPSQTTISITPTSTTADGLASALITVQVKDSQGNNLSSGGNTIALSEDGSAVIGTINDIGDGTYTASLTNTVSEVIIVSGTLGGIAISDSASVTFTPGAAVVTQTTISASVSSVTADGASTSTITVQTIDNLGNNLQVGGNTIALSNNGSASITSVTDNNNGTYTATITNTVAEIVTISGTLDAVSITDTATVTFTAGSVDATQTTINTSPSSVLADGATISTVTVQTKDAQGNDIITGGDTVLLTENGSATISGVNDIGDGTYTATVTNLVAESITISGTLNGTNISDTGSITFTPGVSTTAQTTITTSPSSVTADGVSTSTITVQTKDVNGNNLTSGGATINLSENGSAIISAVTDNTDGSYTASISNTVAENITITGTLNGSGIISTAAVNFLAGSAASVNETIISVSPTSLTADGTSSAIITTQAKDTFGNNITSGGLSVALTENGSAVISPVIDNGNGTYTATITNSVAENIIISGTMNAAAITDTASITFTVGAANVTTTTITASPTTLTADGSSISTITVQTKDSQGNNLIIGGNTILLSENGSANLSGVTDIGNGTYTATITNTVAETITISGQLNASAILDTAKITFSPGVATTTQSLITATPLSLIADGISSATITLQTKDALGNNLNTGGSAITFAETGSANISAVTDNNDGTYSATITNTVAESITVSGTLDGGNISDTAIITFNAGSSSLTNSTISSTPVSVIANGVSSATITVQTIDALGNPLTSGGGTITLSSTGSVSLSPVIDVGDGSYTATITNTVAEGVTVSGTLGGSPLSQSASVTFTPGAGNTATSTITTSVNSVSADGTSSATLTVTLKDAQGNNLTSGGQTVALSNTGSGTISAITDNNNGTYTATITNTIAESTTISGTLNGATLTDTAIIVFTSGTISTGTTLISASPSTTDANGVSNIVITIQAKDNLGNNLTFGGSTIALNQNGSASIQPVIDNGDGTYTASVSSTVAETILIQGTVDGSPITNTESITFLPGPATTAQTTITATPAIITANGITNSTINIQTKDAQGNNLTAGGATILLSTTGSATLSTTTDNGNGTYQATITNTVAETTTISGTLGGASITDTTDITFTPGAVSLTETTITIVPLALVADGTSTVSVTIQTKDSFGNNLQTGGLSIALTQDGSASFSALIDLGDGRYTAAISNTVAELVTVGATIDGETMSNTDQLLFIAGSASPTNSAITASLTTVAADGLSSSIITVQTKDTEGNNLSNGGLDVLLAVTGSAILSTINDEGDGTYTATVTNNLAEIVTITGSIEGLMISGSVNITFTPGASSAANTTITASSSLVTADGNDSSLLTIQVYDALGNLLSVGGDSITLSSSNNAIIGPISDHLDGSYSASITNTSIQITTVSGQLNGIDITDTETINFVQGGPAQINATDGRFINGFAPLGSSITIQDSLGSTLCTSSTDADTGKYHCLITAAISNGQQLTVIATDLANNSESSSILVDSNDNDDDGISNTIETLISNNGGNLNTQPNTDSDGDMLPDYAEVILDSNFLSIDSPAIAGNADIDVDGLSDALEFFFNAAGGAADSQLSTDTDNDGIPDITELITNNSNFNRVDLPVPNGSFDSDGNTVTDAVEFYLSTLFIEIDSMNSDYDRDGYSDALEVRLASTPLRANQADIDNDGINNAIEAYLTGTINDNADTVLLDRDNDELADIFEISLTTDLNNPSDDINTSENGDIDTDGITDAIEVYLTGNATSASPTQDSDNDGAMDISELSWGSNAFRNSKPVIWIDVKDLGGGSIEIYANLGGYQSPPPAISWDTTDILQKDPGAVILAPHQRMQAITGLSEGKYNITLTVEKDIGGVLFSSTVNQFFSVTNAGFNDNDFDGITDEFDYFNGSLGLEENLHTAIGFTNNYQMQLQYGAGIRSGLIAHLGDNAISTISYAQMRDYVYQIFPITPGNTEVNDNIDGTPNLFDISIVNAPSAGELVSIVIPLNRPLSSEATILWFNSSNYYWNFFDTSSTDSLLSTTGSPGTCPPPGDSSYNVGLSEGNYCLQLQITDGGINDQDQRLNGVIPLLVGIGSNNHLPDDIVLDDGLDLSVQNEPEVPEETGSQDTSNNASNNNSSGSGGSINPLVLLLLTLTCLGTGSRSYSGPQNGTITSGAGTIVDTPTLTTINQSTDKLAIEWDSFDIANGETVTFVQPNPSSIALNHDFSGSPSEIFGNLNANGQIILLNSAGILIGETGSVNVGSFLASDLTTNIDTFADGDFSLTDGNTQQGGISNLGSIRSVAESGVYIVGQFISNGGDIISSNGDIHMTIADNVIVSTSPNGLLGVQVNAPIKNNISESNSLISNNGSIVALNGNIYLDLYYSDTIKANAVKNTGIINAVEITSGTGGIELNNNAIFLAPTNTDDIDGIITESLPDDTAPSSPTVDIELTPQPKVSLNTIMPDCQSTEKELDNCSKYQAIKRYLGRLLLGGRLPESDH